VNRSLGFHLTYDEPGDVLYLSRSREIAAHGTEDVDGIVWRHNGAGDLVGATIPAFHEIWLNDRPRLESKLASRFHISIDQARDAVEDAFEATASST